MIRTLHGRLTAVLFALLTAFGGVALWTTLATTSVYSEAAEQRLHRLLASQLVASHLPLSGGRIQQRELTQVFDILMVVNPSIEVYLLDAEGRILEYSAPPGRVRRQRVGLEPVEALLAGDHQLPIRGDDPRNPGRRKIFSAAPIEGPDGPEGYLYVILAGEEHESVFQRVAGDGILRLATAWTIAILALALLSGLLLFRVLTRRLRRLSEAIRTFEASGFSEAPTPPGAERQEGVAGGDEIEQLAKTFHGMAGKIVSQIGELTRLDELRRELVANVSHDLRTPLTHIQGYLETLLLREQSVEPEERRRYLEIALRESERLGSLVGDLFDLAKLESGTMTPRREVVSLTELAQDVVQKFRLAGSSGVLLDAELPQDLALVMGDTGQLERVLENLLGNAVRHTPADGKVEVHVRKRGSDVEVSVDDTGGGIPAEEVPFVFRRYYRRVGVEDREAPRQTGAGLGLAIAQRVVELHGATLTCRSEPGRGTSFSFTLPEAAASSKTAATGG